MNSYIALILAAFCWGLIGPLARFLFQHGIGAIEIAFWRSFLGGLFFLVLAKKQDAVKNIKNLFFPILSFSILAVTALECSNLLAVKYGGAAFASILLYSAPIWVAIFSKIILKEKFKNKKIFALCITIFAVIGFSISGNSINLEVNVRGLVFGIISGLSYSLFYIYGKYYFGKIDAFLMYGISFLLASLFIFPFVHFEKKTQTDYFLLLLIGFVSTFLAYGFYSKGLKKINATTASLLLTLEPVFALIFSILIWNEKLSANGYFFGSLIFLGIILGL